MKKTMSPRRIAHGAIIAALYVVLTHMQNFLLPGTTTAAVQVRISEALCILAFFTPAAVPGLTLGCMLFNLTSGAALPFDFLIGSLATLIAALVMWKTRGVTVKGYPLLGMVMPALTNAILVGAELEYYFGGGFAYNAFFVALGELIAVMVIGSVLYYAMRSRHMDEKLLEAE